MTPGSMLDNFISLLNDNTPLSSPWGRIVVIAAVFALAWLVARTTAWAAGRILAWHDRRHTNADLEATGTISDLKRRETLVSVIRTGITYVTFAVAAVVIVGQLTGGVDRLTAIAGASFLLILARLRHAAAPRGHHRGPDDVRRALVLGRRHRHPARRRRAPGRRRGRDAAPHAAPRPLRRGHPGAQLPDPGGLRPATRREGARHRGLRRQARAWRAPRRRRRPHPPRGARRRSSAGPGSSTSRISRTTSRESACTRPSRPDANGSPRSSSPISSSSARATL